MDPDDGGPDVTISRRQFVGSGVVAGVGAGLLAACGPDDSRSAPTSTTPASTAPGPAGEPVDFERFLAGRGYTAVPAAPLITGSDFNGGLRYDDDAAADAPKSYVKQQAARVEDVAKRSNPGTLPLFTIVALDTSTPELADGTTTAVLEYLTGTAGLDRARLRATTTDRSSGFFPLLERFGIGRSQIRLRPWDEAVRDGSGSGYFAPPGHPGGPAAPSFSIEYVMPDGSELEIAEISHGTGSGRTSGGIGVERVAMARAGAATDWDGALAAFNDAVRAEARRTGVALPPGVATISGAEAPTTTG